MTLPTRIVLFVAVTSVVMACRFPRPEDVPDDARTADGAIDAASDASTAARALGGTVSGLWTGGAITLHLDAGGAQEDLAADASHPFAFVARLADGTSYRVSVLDDGPDHDCTVTNGSGRIDGADVADLAVACTNLIPHGIAISTPTAFTFDPRVMRYMLPVSVLQQETTIVVSGATLTSASIGGQPVVIGQASAPFALGAGQTTVIVDVAKGPLSNRYELVFDRGATPITEALYGRASNAEAEDSFGLAVAASGDFVAIGAPAEDGSTAEGNDNKALAAGAVYAFRRSGATWTQTQMFRGSVVDAYRNFGTALSMDGDVLVVGAPHQGGFTPSPGSVYVFRWSAATSRWVEQQRITASDPHATDRYGAAVAVSGDRIAVAASGHDNGVSGADTGLVYMYRWDGTRWAEEARVRQPSPQNGDQLGGIVALDGDTLVASRGASNDVFVRSGAVWSRQASLPRGFVAIDGDQLAIGQTYDASGNGQPGDQSAPNAGAVRAYQRSGTTWSEVAYLKASPPQANAQLGTGVSILGNVIVTAASGTGAVHTFQRVGGSWVAIAAQTPSGITANAGLGIGIALTRVGAVVAAPYDFGPGGTSAESGTAWFFR